MLPWKTTAGTRSELAFLIAKARWREGLATEAALGIVACARTVLQLDRLICVITPGNVASVDMAQKVGMRFEREYTDELGRCHLCAHSLELGR